MPKHGWDTLVLPPKKRRKRNQYHQNTDVLSRLVQTQNVPFSIWMRRGGLQESKIEANAQCTLQSEKVPEGVEVRVELASPVKPNVIEPFLNPNHVTRVASCVWMRCEGGHDKGMVLPLETASTVVCAT